MFDGLPDGPARGAFTRTLRSVVDWRGQVVTMLDRSYLAEGMPMLLVWGTRDAVIPIDHAQPGPRGHARQPARGLRRRRPLPAPRRPDRFVADLRDFVSTTEPARHDPVRRKELLDQGGWRPPPEPDPFRWWQVTSRRRRPSSSSRSSRSVWAQVAVGSVTRPRKRVAPVASSRMHEHERPVDDQARRSGPTSPAITDGRRGGGLGALLVDRDERLVVDVADAEGLVRRSWPRSRPGRASKASGMPAAESGAAAAASTGT